MYLIAERIRTFIIIIITTIIIETVTSIIIITTKTITINKLTKAELGSPTYARKKGHNPLETNTLRSEYLTVQDTHNSFWFIKN